MDVKRIDTSFANDRAGTITIDSSTQGEIDTLWIAVDTESEIFAGTATLAITPGNTNDLIIVPPGRIPPKGGRIHDKPTR